MAKKKSTTTTTPTDHAPAPPKGWKASTARPKRAPTGQQVRDALDVGSELTRSRSYREDMGSRAPDAVSLEAQLAAARAWSDEAAAADLWSSYAHTQRDAAWDVALASMKQLQQEFSLADAHDPAISKRYPQTKAFLAVRTQAAQRAVATRRAKKKAKPA